MPVIELAVEINAPVERVFDLSRSVRAHLESTRDTGEVLVEGPRGLLGLGDQVTWEARHLGLRQRLSARITEFDRPTHFRDSMVTRGLRGRPRGRCRRCRPCGTRTIPGGRPGPGRGSRSG